MSKPSVFYFRVNARCLMSLIFLISACQMKNSDSEELPHLQETPLFQPYRSNFPCHIEVAAVPPIDSQADEWFRHARALEDPNIFVDDRDYKSIVNLTRQAAERRHWMAMLNLASLYLEGRDPLRGDEDALKLVDDAMRFGVPAAYDRMGTYFINGTAVEADASIAYAFWQKAAELGNPFAMFFLAEKLNVGKDSEGNGKWSNIPIATKMLECAFAQGYGRAADSLHYLYAAPRSETGRIIGDRTAATKNRALRILHSGVKLGCADCAIALSIEFGRPFDLSRTLAPVVDKARGERYQMLGRALEFNPSRRFPNLDRILPLPPAELPPWDGTRDSLLQAARGVTPPPAAPVPSAASQLTGRYFLNAAYALRKSGATTSERTAPFEGYWQPRMPKQTDRSFSPRAQALPGLYRKGEPFDIQYAPDSKGTHLPLTGLVWEHSLTIRHNHGAIEPQATAGLTSVVARPLPLRSARADAPCPVTGVWQPWLSDGHPLQAAVNQFWRQSWLRAGEPFPQPQRDWLLNVPATELTWHLMDSDNTKAQ